MQPLRPSGAIWVPNIIKISIGLDGPGRDHYGEELRKRQSPGIEELVYITPVKEHLNNLSFLHFQMSPQNNNNAELAKTFKNVSIPLGENIFNLVERKGKINPTVRVNKIFP